MWVFNTTLLNWGYFGGPTSINQPGNWGVKGVESDSNWPSARYAPVSFRDSAGNFWLYGGSGYDAAGQPGSML